MKREVSSEKIVKTLAEEAPLTIYAMAKKSGVAVSFVHRVVKQPEVGLEVKKIVKVLCSGTWRTGLKRAEYILTFRGLVERLNLLFEERKPNGRVKVKEIVRRYRQFYDYPVFTELEYLEAWLGEKVYDFICSTAWMLKNYPPHVPIIGNISGWLPTIIQGDAKEQRYITVQSDEKILMHAFTLVFFDLAAPESPEEKTNHKPNSSLYRLANDTYGELRQAFRQRLKNVEELEYTLKKRFGT